MVNYNLLQYSISNKIHIKGIPNVNVHISYVDEELLQYNFVDVRFQDGTPILLQYSGFSQEEAQDIFTIVVQKKEEILTHSTKEEIFVESEEELYH